MAKHSATYTDCHGQKIPIRDVPDNGHGWQADIVADEISIAAQTAYDTGMTDAKALARGLLEDLMRDQLR